MKNRNARLIIFVCSAVLAFLALTALVLGGMTAPGVALAQSTSHHFDHLSTGFDLEGAHRDVPCESCHVGAVFDGTPRECRGCHLAGSRIGALPKPIDHIMSSDECGECHSASAWSPAVRFDHLQIRGSCVSCHNNVQSIGKPLDHIESDNICDSCHSTTAWSPARFDHSLVVGNCASCHDNVRATGKPADHIASDNLCESCHSTTAWSPARFDHAQVVGNCVSCHDNVQATGKPTDHIASDDVCENCHTTTAWLPARFDHRNVTPGTCSTCHNAVAATGKPLTHAPTTAECDSCHSTLAWTPAIFDHAGVTGGCTTCHNGANATGKNVGHMTTMRECNVCHATTAWMPHTFAHTSPEYPGDHRGDPACTMCHTTNTDQATWPTPAYRPDCAGCHANDFESGPHTKVLDTNIRYTVGELRNCSGACHVYSDTTLTTIARQRPGPEHRANGGDF